MHLSLPLLSMILFVCHFAHPCGVREGSVCLAAYATPFVNLPTSFSLTFTFVEITFTPEINLVPFKIFYNHNLS